MYQDIKPLLPTTHGKLKLTPITDYSFAKGSHAVPTIGPEFTELMHDYVIAFGREANGEYSALVTLGMRDSENLYLTPTGAWDDRYIPVFLRRYPFIVSEMADGDAIVCIDDAAAAKLHDAEKGVALFENDEPTEAARHIAQNLFRLRDDIKRDKLWIKKLADADVMKEVVASTTLADGKKVNLTGIWVIDEEKLRALPTETLAEWMRNGMMSIIYAQLFSLSNLGKLVERLHARVDPQALAAS